MTQTEIVVRGAREHNLKSIDVTIPRDRLVVITGLSGSGKSSLAFDTLYAEGQRRYVESLSSYARQFLGQMKKPEVERVEGLSPAISIDQKTVHRNPRSTVGTVTEIYDYLRLLFAHVGKAHCPSCGDPIAKQSPQEIVRLVLGLPEGTKAQILAPIVRGRKGTYGKVFKDLLAKGYARARVNGEVHNLESPPDLARYEKHDIEAVVDRIVVKPDAKSRIQESIEQALRDGEGLVIVELQDGKKTKDLLFSEHFACARCGTSLPEIVPRIFSFNSPHGACEECSGLGFSLQVDEAKVVVDPTRPMQEGAIHRKAWRINPWTHKWLRGVARERGVDLSKPFRKLPKGYQELVLYGTEEYGGSIATRKYASGWEWEGIIPRMERLFRASESTNLKAIIQEFQRETPCKRCGGDRLRPEVLGVKVQGMTIIGVTRLSVTDAVQWFDALPERLSEHENRIAHEVIKEIRARLGFLKDVGLGYLSLDRASGTLSGGEAQRIRLATQIGSGLVGVLYILDEPSIGLHQRDNKRLLATLQHLRDVGNTVIVVEHDEETMWAADHLIDLGPGAGPRRHDRRPRHPTGSRRGQRQHHRRLPLRTARHRGPARTPPGERQAAHRERCTREQPQRHRRHLPARNLRSGDRRLRERQVELGERGPREGGAASPRRGRRGAGRT
jgi:excinuclease ABC subunit A